MDQERDRGRIDPPVTEPADDPARIREQIEHTRANLSGTLEELQDRLRPQHLVSQAGDAVRTTVEQKVRTMVDTATDRAGRVARQARTTAASATRQMQEHPVPVALAIGGLTWGLMRARRGRSGDLYEDGASGLGVWPAVAAGALGYYLLSRGFGRRSAGVAGEYGDLGANEYGAYGYTEGESGSRPLGERVRELTGTAAERARHLGESAARYGQRAQAAVGSVAGQVGEQARQFGEAARTTIGETTTMVLERSEELGENFDRWMHENPLAVGVAFFALGALAGLSVPVTRTEHRTLGAARQTLMQKAGEAVQSAVSSPRPA